MCENNQYGSQWQKPMPTCCLKEDPTLSWLKFSLLLKTVNLDDKIGYLFVVDIEFDKKRGTGQEYMYNEILPLIIEKQDILETNERSV